MPTMKMRFLVTFVLLTGFAFAQSPGKKSPSVTVAPIDLVTVTRGKGAPVSLHFRVAPGFHINSNTPKSEFLIPTALKMDAPTDIALTRTSYPAGKDMTFPFAPDEPLNVYTGDFTVSMTVRPLHTVQPGKYAIHGDLKYQACDNAACYPPKHLPVDFEVKVLKGATPHGKNPAQSPHAHR
ncbi:MAG: protein-disulfide reductase DsbD domain-containing protein [Terriglobales bacterium]